MRKGFKKQPDLSLKNVGLWDHWWSQVKNLPANAGTWVPSRSRENSHAARQPSLCPAARAATARAEQHCSERGPRRNEGKLARQQRPTATRDLQPPETNKYIKAEFIKHWAFLVASQRVGNH